MEILITLLVMSVGLLGLAGIQATAIKDSMDVAKRSQVTFLVSELAERIHANPDGAMNYATTIDTASCAGSAPFNCSDSSSGDGGNCTAQQVATFDVWEVFCGYDAGAGIMANSVDPLNLTQVEISCVDGNCNNNNEDYIVEISWESAQVDNSTLLSSGAKSAQQSRSISMRVRP